MTEPMSDRQPEPGQEASASHAVAKIVTQLGSLIGSELALARAELVAQARQFSIGGIALLTAVAAGGIGGLLFVAAAVLAISMALPAWAAALIVGGAFVLAAGAIGGWATHRLAKAGKPLPMTTESVRKDLLVLMELHLGRNNGQRPPAARPEAAQLRARDSS